jgi:hypothetical protein
MTVRHATEIEEREAPPPPALAINPLVLVAAVMLLVLAVWALIWIPFGF